MTEIEFIEVDSADRKLAKLVAAQQKSDDELIEETKEYCRNLFRNMGGANERV